MKDKERDYIKKLGIFLVGLIAGILLDKYYVNMSMDGGLILSPNNSNVESKLPNLPISEMVSEEDFGNWIGKSGICIDSCNERVIENGALQIDLNEDETVISGWAADFWAQAPLSELYMQIGNRYIKCNYGIDRQSVVDYYQLENLRCTGIEVTVPNKFFDESVTTVAFIGVSADSSSIYEPVYYEVIYY